MAKTSIRQRELKKEKVVNRYRARTTEIKESLRKLYVDPANNHEKIMELQATLNSFPRYARAACLTSRCRSTGRSRGVYSRVRLSKTKFREHGMRGEIPGLQKASW